MQLLYLLPSLIYALVFALQGNNPWMLIATLASTLIAVIVRWRQSSRASPNQLTEFRIEGKRVWLDDRKLPRSGILWSKAENEFVLAKYKALTAQSSSVQRSYLDSDFQLEPEQLRFVIGFNDQLVELALAEAGPHAILVGPTGAGKTVLLQKMLVELLRHSHFDLQLLDFKGGIGLAQFAAFAGDFETDRDLVAAEQLLFNAEAELTRREVGGVFSRPWLLVIDELAHLLARIPKAVDTLSSISARGRAFGMHLIITNQNLVGVPRSLLSNLRLRILVGDTDPVDAAMLGQGAKATMALEAVPGFGIAKLASHHASLRQFYFALPRPRELKPESQPLGHEPLQRLGSTTGRRVSSGQVRGRHRLHRRRAIPGWQSHEHKAESR